MCMVWLLLSFYYSACASDDSSIHSYEAKIFFVEENRKLLNINHELRSENFLLKISLANLLEVNHFIDNEKNNLIILTEFNFDQIKKLESENDRLRQILQESNKKKAANKVVYSNNNQLGSKFSCRKKEGCSQEKINDLFTKIHEKRMHEKK